MHSKWIETIENNHFPHGRGEGHPHRTPQKEAKSQNRPDGGGQDPDGGGTAFRESIFQNFQLFSFFRKLQET